MRINKLAPFYTDQDKEIWLKSQQEYAQLLKKTRAINIEMSSAGLTKDSTQYQELKDKFDIAYLDYFHGAQMDWVFCQDAILQRYFDSLGGDKAAILADIQDVVNAATKKDFLNYVQAMKEAGEPILKGKPGPDSYVSDEEYAAWKKHTESSWENCVHYLRSQTDEQFQALEFFKFDTGEAVAILEARASKFCKRPDKTSNEIAAAAEKYPDYFLTRQNATTNEIARTITNRTRNLMLDKVMDSNGDFVNRGTVRNGNFELSILNFKLPGLRQSAQQLLDEIITVFTFTGGKNPKVSFSLEEHMNLRGQKDKKSSREQVKEDLEAIFCTRVSHTYTTKKNGKKVEEDFHDMRIIDAKGIRNGIVTVTLGTTFFSHISTSEYMYYPKQSQKFISTRNPYSYLLMRKMAIHIHMNYGKKNQNIISTLALADYAGIPTYEEIMQSSRQVEDRIIGPFERDMDACRPAIKWHYCKSGGEELEDVVGYQEWSNAYVYFELPNYPELAKRIEEPKSKTKKPKQKKSAAT